MPYNPHDIETQVNVISNTVRTISDHHHDETILATSTLVKGLLTDVNRIAEALETLVKLEQRRQNQPPPTGQPGPKV